MAKIIGNTIQVKASEFLNKNHETTGVTALNAFSNNKESKSVDDTTEYKFTYDKAIPNVVLHNVLRKLQLEFQLT